MFEVEGDADGALAPSQVGADGAEEAEFEEEGGLDVADELGGVLVVWLCSWVLSFFFFWDGRLDLPIACVA